MIEELSFEQQCAYIAWQEAAAKVSSWKKALLAAETEEEQQRIATHLDSAAKELKEKYNSWLAIKD